MTHNLPRCGGLPAACHLSPWVGMGVRYDSDRSFSDRINMKWLHPRDVIDGLITAGMSGQAA